MNKPPEHRTEDSGRSEGKGMEHRNRSAADDGWRLSRYNLSARLSGTDRTVIANLYRGTCGVYADLELELMQDLAGIDAENPLLSRWSGRGLIVRFDERAALEAMGRGACACPFGVVLTICPTMGCNFDCPYCFETHRPGKMSPQTQEETAALAERMLDASGAKTLHIDWFGGEPLLAPDVIETLSDRLMGICKDRGVSYSATLTTNGYLLTPDVAEMLGRVKVGQVQVTLDGLGSLHDATRHLAGGGPTFGRITDNLRQPGLPFQVAVRHNVHEGNLQAVRELRDFVGKLAAESGNSLMYYSAPVHGSGAADARGEQVALLCGTEESGIGLETDARRFGAGRGHYCGAQSIWSAGVDEQGRLYRCWETVDKPEQSFGTAADWDPRDPVGSAARPDRLTEFLNTACPIGDPECMECVWLPLCRGGCPFFRISGSRRCVPYREEPERFVLALYRRIREQQAESAGK